MNQLLVRVVTEYFVAGAVFDQRASGEWHAILCAPILRRHMRRIARKNSVTGKLVVHFKDFEEYMVQREWKYEIVQVSKDD